MKKHNKSKNSPIQINQNLVNKPKIKIKFTKFLISKLVNPAITMTKFTNLKQ